MSSASLSSSSSSSSASESASAVAAVSFHHGLSKTNRLIVIIAASVGGLVVLVILVVLIIWRRKRYRKYGPPSDLTRGGPRDGASGWADDTWGPKADEEPVHPSLIATARMKKGRLGHGRAKNDGSSSDTPASSQSLSVWSQPSVDMTDRSKSTSPLAPAGVVVVTAANTPDIAIPIPVRPPVPATTVVAPGVADPASLPSASKRGPEGNRGRGATVHSKPPSHTPAESTSSSYSASGVPRAAGRSRSGGRSGGNSKVKVKPSSTSGAHSPPIITPTSATYILSPDPFPSMLTSAGVRSPQNAGSPLTSPLSGSLSGEMMSPRSPSNSPSYILTTGNASSIGGHEPLTSDLGAAIYPPLRPSASFSSVYSSATANTPLTSSLRPPLSANTSTSVRMLPRVPSNLDTASAISLSRAPTTSSAGATLSRGSSAAASVPEDVSPTGTSPPGPSKRLPRPRGIIGPSNSAKAVASVLKVSPPKQEDPDRPPSYDAAPR